MLKPEKIYYGNLLVGNVPVEITPGTFAGISLSPGPLWGQGSYTLNNYSYTYTDWGICDDFRQHNSYGIGVVGPGSGTPGFVDGSAYDNGYQTYFNWKKIGTLFDSSGDSYYTGSNVTNPIDNQGTLVSSLTYDGKTGWRLPTSTEWSTILFGNITSASGFTRNGSTVNNTSNVFSCVVRLQLTTSVGYQASTNATGSILYGVLLFPDDKTIAGSNPLTASLSYSSLYSSKTNPHYANSNFMRYSDDMSATPATLLTEAELDEYIIQGCTFIPDMGRCYQDLSSMSWISIYFMQTYGQYYNSSIYMSNEINYTPGNMSLQFLGPLVFDWMEVGISTVGSSSSYGGSNYDGYCPVYLVNGTYTPIESQNWIQISTIGGNGTVLALGADYDATNYLVNPPIVKGPDGTAVSNVTWQSSTQFSTLMGLMQNYTLNSATIPTSYTYA